MEKGGENFYKNFKSLEQLGKSSYVKVKPIRPTLGDFTHIYLSDIKTLSLLAIQPKCMKELCDMYRLMGYYGIDHALKTLKLSRIVDIISNTRLFWRVLTNREIQKALKTAFEKQHEAIIEIEKVNARDNYVAIRIEEDSLFYLQAGKSLNFVDLNAIGGVLEALCNKKCVGEEKTIRGKRYFIYEIHPKKEEVEYPITILDAEEYDKLVDKLVDHIVNKKPSGRVKLEDNYHISCEQAAVYFITKISEGHRILEKHSGVKCGRKISKQADIKRLDKSLEYAQQLFQYTKAGILHKPERRDDRITIKMTESAYSSGVNNINMKLDLFLAGMIEGLLKESTGGDWQVDETKCLANGDDYCEFTCKPR